MMPETFSAAEVVNKLDMQTLNLNSFCIWGQSYDLDWTHVTSMRTVVWPFDLLLCSLDQKMSSNGQTFYRLEYLMHLESAAYSILFWTFFVPKPILHLNLEKNVPILHIYKLFKCF